MSRSLRGSLFGLIVGLGLASVSAQEVTDPTPDPSLMPTDPVVTDGAPLDNPDVIFYSFGSGGPDEWPLPEVRNDEFPIDDPMWSWSFDPDDPDVIFYNTAGGSLSSIAQTGNQLAVARVLDSASFPLEAIIQETPPPEVSGPGLSEFGVLVSLLQQPAPPVQQVALLNALSGEVYGSLNSLGLQTGDRALRVVSQRMLNTIGVLGADAASQLGDRSDPLRPAELLRGQSPRSSVGGWVQGFGANSSINGNGTTGFADAQLGGLAYGVDLIGDERSLFGISGGHGWTDFQTGDGAQGDITSHHVGLHGIRHFGGSVYLMGLAQYGRLNYQVTRTIPLGLFPLTATGGLSGNAFQSYLEAGAQHDAGLVRLQPFLGIQYQVLANGRATEQGAFGANLQIQGATTQAAYAHVGTRVAFHGWSHRHGATLTPYLNARWMAELIGESRTTGVNFAGLPALGWSVAGARPGRSIGMFGPGILWQLSEQLSIFANYDLQVGDRYLSHSGNGGLSFTY